MLFQNFSHVYEKTFRIVFIVWASLWLFINFFEIVYQYSIFEQKYYENLVVSWALNTVSTIISFSIGVVLLAMTIAIPYKIAKGQEIQFLPLMKVLVAFYYLFLTLIRSAIDITYSATSEEAIKTFVFSTSWIFPSLVLMVFHFIYFYNLSKYTESLGKNSAGFDQAVIKQ